MKLDHVFGVRGLQYETQRQRGTSRRTAFDIGKVAAKLFGREDIQDQVPLLIASGIFLAHSAGSSGYKNGTKLLNCNSSGEGLRRRKEPNY